MCVTYYILPYKYQISKQLTLDVILSKITFGNILMEKRSLYSKPTKNFYRNSQMEFKQENVFFHRRFSLNTFILLILIFKAIDIIKVNSRNCKIYLYSTLTIKLL